MKRILNRKKERVMPEVSTASLPDIIFMLLFFFMVVTVMRTTDLKMNLDIPATKENEKIKSIIDQVSIQLGEDAEKILVNDQFVDLENLESFFNLIAKDIHKEDRLSIPVYLRVDRKSAMGAVFKVKLALRKTGLRKVNYIVKNKSV